MNLPIVFSLIWLTIALIGMIPATRNFRDTWQDLEVASTDGQRIAKQVAWDQFGQAFKLLLVNVIFAVIGLASLTTLALTPTFRTAAGWIIVIGLYLVEIASAALPWLHWRYRMRLLADLEKEEE